MKVNDIYISKTFLEMGKDLELSENLKVKHPTIGEILALGFPISSNKVFLGENIYWTYVFSLICDPYSNMVLLDDMGYDYEEISPFDLFCIKWKKELKDYENNKDFFDSQSIHPLDLTKQSLNFFLGEEHDFDLFDFGENKLLIDKNNESCIIDENIFIAISSFVQAINGIKFEDRIKPKDKNAKRILIEDMRDEQRFNEKKNKDNEDEDFIGKIVTGSLHGANSNIQMTDIENIKIFSLYSHYITRIKKDSYDSSILGCYCGMGKMSKMESSIMNWMI